MNSLFFSFLSSSYSKYYSLCQLCIPTSWLNYLKTWTEAILPSFIFYIGTSRVDFSNPRYTDERALPSFKFALLHKYWISAVWLELLIGPSFYVWRVRRPLVWPASAWPLTLLPGCSFWTSHFNYPGHNLGAFPKFGHSRRLLPRIGEPTYALLCSCQVYSHWPLVKQNGGRVSRASSDLVPHWPKFVCLLVGGTLGVQCCWFSRISRILEPLVLHVDISTGQHVVIPLRYSPQGPQI